MSGPSGSTPEIPQVVRAVRARTQASISRMEPTSTPTPSSDLAQAIVSLARASEKRRGARADLIEATDTIAKAIRKELRTGDEVQITFGPREQRVRGVRVTVSGMVTYRASRVRMPAGITYKDVLLRYDEGEAILGLADGDTSSQSLVGTTWLDDQERECRPATAEDREAFVMEAPAVVQAFRELLEAQAQKFDESARKATKLTIK